MSSYSTINSNIASGSDIASFDTLIAALGSFLLIIIILVLAIAIPTIIGQWKMFKKAGKEGYASLIPVYSTILEMQISGMPIYWYFLNYCTFIPTVGWIAGTVFSFWKNINLAKAFGKGVGTGVLLTFFPFVMYPVLGFGSAQYVGNEKTTKTE